MTMKLMIT